MTPELIAKIKWIGGILFGIGVFVWAYIKKEGLTTIVKWVMDKRKSKKTDEQELKLAKAKSLLERDNIRYTHIYSKKTEIYPMLLIEINSTKLLVNGYVTYYTTMTVAMEKDMMIRINRHLANLQTLLENNLVYLSNEAMELGKNVHTILSELPSTKRKLMILVNTSKSMDTIKTAEAKFYELQNSLDEQVVLLTTSVHTELVQPTNPS